MTGEGRSVIGRGRRGNGLGKEMGGVREKNGDEGKGVVLKGE